MGDTPEMTDQDRWIRLEGHASAMVGLLMALAQSGADQHGRVPPDLEALYDDVEHVWRTIHGRLFPD
jgi:hypothetical protein